MIVESILTWVFNVISYGFDLFPTTIEGFNLQKYDVSIVKTVGLLNGYLPITTFGTILTLTVVVVIFEFSFDVVTNIVNWVKDLF